MGKYTESIMQDKKECFVISHKLVNAPLNLENNYYDLECHHIFFGTANRKLSEKYGLKVWLCKEFHTGNSGVHHNRTLDLLLKEMAQRKFEEHYKGTYNRSDFIRIFGKSYL